MKACVNCLNLLKNTQLKYCSNKCQQEFQYKNFITNWKKKSLPRAKVNTKNVSKYLKRYLMEKLQGRCSECGWNKVHPITNKLSLEVDHIDGNSGNNDEDNLRILCPNCHSLTVNYKNLNKGRGRQWRMVGN
jgi:hypothetical protein